MTADCKKEGLGRFARTVMGSFQSEVMPATADNAGDGHGSPAGCSNTGPPLCDRFKLSRSSKSPFSSTTGYTSP